MQIRQKRLQFYPGLRFLTLFCVTMLPLLSASGSLDPGEMMFSVMGNILRSTSLILSGDPLLSGGQMDLIVDHIRNIFSKESLVNNQRPWRFSITN